MIIAWLPCEKGLSRQEVGDGPIPAQAVWLDVVEVTPEEEKRIEALGIEVPTRAEMQEIEVSSRLYRNGNAVYMTANMLVRTETEAPGNSAVTFILTRNLLVTLRYEEPWTFRVFPQRAPKSGAQTAEQTFSAILDTTVERLADLLELVSVELENLSLRIFGRRKQARDVDLQRALHNIGRCGNIAGKVRESLLDKQRMLTFVEQASLDWLPPEAVSRIHALQRDIQSLSDHSSFTASKINFLLDASLGLINNDVNQQMKRMSAIMIAVMWPALVSGFFAMNVQLPFPQQNHIWPFYLCLSLAFGPLAIGAIWWFRSNKRH